MISAHQRRAHRGFTLIEVMITVVVISILASIALPSYREHVDRSRRLAAQATLLEAAQFMERFYTQNGNYLTALPGGLTVSPPGSSGTSVMYTISLTPAASTYTLTAEPQNAQAQDRCGTMSLNEKGVRSVSKGTESDCWRR